jgi:hypothetical protein
LITGLLVNVGQEIHSLDTWQFGALDWRRVLQVYNIDDFRIQWGCIRFYELSEERIG